MAGIFGALAFSSRVDLNWIGNTLQQAAQSGFEHPQSILASTNGVIGYACPHHFGQATSLFRAQTGEYTFVLFGEMFLTDGSTLSEANFDKGFLQPFLASKNNFLLQLDGAFCFALLGRDTCIVANDPFGNFAIHYGVTKEVFVFSTQIHAVAGACGKPSIDETGIFEHLGAGMTMNGRTTIQGVMRLPNASYVEVAAGVCTVHRYYRPSFPGRARSIDEVMPEIQLALQESVARRMRSDGIFLALTGGFDSRLTLSLALRGSARAPVAHTHGLPSAHALTVSRKICTRFDISLDKLVFTESLLAEQPRIWKEIARLSEGTISLAHAPAFIGWRYLSQRSKVLVDSYGGAYYRRQHMKIAERTINQSRNVPSQILNFESSALYGSPLLRAEVSGQARMASIAAMQQYWSTLSPSIRLGDAIDQFYFEQLDPFKNSLTSNVQMNYVGVRHPLLTLRAIDLAWSLPLRDKRRDLVHRNAIHAAFSGLEQIGMDNVGFPAPYRGFSKWRYGPMIVEKIIRETEKRGVTALRNISLRRPTMDIDALLRPYTNVAKELLLSGDARFDPYIDRDCVERSLDQFAHGNDQHGRALLQLLGFRLLLADHLSHD